MLAQEPNCVGTDKSAMTLLLILMIYKLYLSLRLPNWDIIFISLHICARVQGD